MLSFTRIATAASIILFIAELGFGEDGLGYTDTPMLPHSQWRVHDRQRPQPAMVEPGQEPGTPPADAIVLFDGHDLAQWDGGNPKGIEQGCINILKTGELATKRRFGDCQLHVEWATPAVADGDSMKWGNSGILFFGKYELQIIESHDSQDLRRRHRRGRLWPNAAAGQRLAQAGPMAKLRHRLHRSPLRG